MATIREQLIQAAKETPEVFRETAPRDWQEPADAAVEGVLLFYGTDPVVIGRRNIDWSGGQVAHQEWVAQLNRFPQLDPLRWGYRLTGEAKYARAARDYIEDWIEQHRPYPPDAPAGPGDTSLNMAIRLGGLRHVGWTAVLADLLPSDAFDEAFARRMVESIRWQLQWLAANLAREGNWRVAGLDCLLSQALRLPGMLDEHVALAAKNLNIEFARQVLPDGVHVERCAGYHDWMCDVFVKLWRISRRRGELPLDISTEHIVRMHAYTMHHTKPDGSCCAFNDASRSRQADESGTSLLARTVKDHRDLLAQAGMPDDISTSGLFTSAGHVFYRTGWGPGDLWWAFDAGGWGGAHSHLSRLSIELHNGGRTTLPDAGIFDYQMTNPLAPAGKSTPMHSTMNLDLCNQIDLDARLTVILNDPQALVVHGRYEGGYWPGTFGWTFVARGPGRFGVHDRTVIWLKDRAMIVLDRLLHEASTPAYLHWVSDDVPIELDEQTLRMRTADPHGNVCIQVCPLCEAQVSACIRRGEKDPYLGWMGSLHNASPAPLFQCCFRALRPQRATVATECVSVIVPFAGREAPALEVAARRIDAAKREVAIEWGDQRADRVVYTAAGSSDYGSSRPTGQIMMASAESSRGGPWPTVSW